MAGERLDYRIERQRHESFVERDELLARIERLLGAGEPDRWILVTGDSGMGKSALLASWLSRREREGAPVPHHFIRRSEYDLDDPVKLVGSLVAQLEALFPSQPELAAASRLPPSARLDAALARVSSRELVPAGRRLAILLDGLEEYDPPPGTRYIDPLSAFMPPALPRGVSFVCSLRPRHAFISRLAVRGGELTRIDLDDPAQMEGNDATVREFWKREARSLGLGAVFIDEATARAGGNLQHATLLRRYLGGLTMAQRRVRSIPSGLDGMLEKLWERVAAEPAAVTGLGLLCAAREALSLEELGVVAGWTDEAPRRAFLAASRELLAELWRADGQREFRLHHESVRELVSRRLGDTVLRGHHGALAARIATWPLPADASARRYALRYGISHRAAAGDWADAWRLASDASFLDTKRRELGPRATQSELARTAARCRAAGNAELAGRFDELARAQAEAR